nr:MAG TPA: ribonucleoside-diphosphate reductase, adenosylcobalamin-dependent [Bacteriophage sp.]
MTENEWLDNNQLSLDIWNNKYRYKNESFENWLDRVSGNNPEIKRLIKEKKFLFGGRILANRGLDKLGKKITLSNCYVIPAPEDSIESIFDCASKLARTFSYGGGCGIDVSKLRPKNAKVNNAANSTSGTTSFMDFFSYVTGLIGQEGRRGATMISIDCTHPDLEEFINLKSDLNLCTKANISIRVSDDFMKAVIEDKDWKLFFNTEHESIEKIVKAKDIFMFLAKRNWEMAEPGILYWDRIENYNMLNTDPNFKFAGVNPCAEEPLPAGGSCLLGSLNLAEYVINPFMSNSRIDFDAIEHDVAIIVQGLNQVLIEGMPLHPLKVQRDSVYNWRQIGLGTLGLGDMFIKLGEIYGSEKSIKIIDNLFHIIATAAVETSLQLAKVEGCYPMCNKEALANSEFIKALNLPEIMLEEIKQYGLFNSQLLTCAPTGSLATMLQVSSGVEPNYAFSFTRRTISLNKEETTYKVEADIVQQYKRVKGDIDVLPDFFISSQQINPYNRLKIQATLQKWIDASISSTLNLPESTTIEDVFNIYVEAWKLGCKGITIWRNNCQRQGILSVDPIQIESPHNFPTRGEIIKAGNDCIGLKRVLMTGCGSLHVNAYFDPISGELRECFLSKGSTGGCQNFMIGLSRMISLSARGGISIDNILDQLKSCGVCPSYAVRSATKKDTSIGSCCPVAVGNALKDMHKEMQSIICKCEGNIIQDKSKEDESNLLECPNCHKKTMAKIGGCDQCISCGYSKCN